jgi:hypothetical protein
MRRLVAWAMLTMVSGLVLAGCGTDFPLPTETREGRLYSTDNSYQMVATWQWSTGDTIADLLLTQGPGTQLFLLFNHAGTTTAPRGAVYGYALKAAPPSPAPIPGIDFRHLFVPAAMCFGTSHVFVLDQGDTLLARDPVTGRVADLSLTWRVKEYGLLGGDTLTSFTDTSLAFVRGIAADDQERVYVSGSAIVLIPDPQDSRIRTRTYQYRVNRYVRSSAGDPYMPGTNKWIRDQSYIVEEGSGLGTLTDPRGLYWAAAVGRGLFAADFGKNWVQKLSDAVSSTGEYKIDADTVSTLNGPIDVAVDLAGYVYLTDTGNRRVLRYDPYGQFVQRVDVELDAYGQTLLDPVGLAADDTLVYVADRAANKVIRYQRRK